MNRSDPKCKFKSHCTLTLHKDKQLKPPYNFPYDERLHITQKMAKRTNKQTGIKAIWNLRVQIKPNIFMQV